MSVKVGVRVRPFNSRESALNCKLCVDMIGNMTRLYDAVEPQKNPRDYTFDYSFWSHDQFTVEESGYFRAQSDKYADQQKVFEAVGLQILQNAWDGYHCCLFAYGQTGSGKSYSMVGYGANKGIVPISCEQIFTRIANNKQQNKQYEVQLSMMEIYNEKIHDLLIPIAKRPKQGHKIRQHKTLGIYVEGMSKHFVQTYDQIEKKMQQGSRNRSIAATQMNASSSRAHTIISIQFKQIEVVEGGKKREKLSVIHLVDLAGSEKVGKTGATGDRLKEATGINLSLTMLGLVISALAQKATGKKKVVIPYRESSLTRILQNALGGNSKTLMICAISPATDNYDETLSTLRYADQAKKIQNKAIVNESQTDKLIRCLTEEREELKQKLLKMEEMYKKLAMTPQQIKQLMQAEADYKFVAEMNNDYEADRKQKRKHEAQQDIFYVKIDVSKPHLVNLNQDPQLSKKVFYSLNQQVVHIGKRGLQVPNDIEIGGMGIRKLHCAIKNIDNVLYLDPIVQGEQEVGCYINGQQLSKQQQIHHLDRISFGINNIFLAIIPQSLPRQEIKDGEIDWDFAQNQLYLKNVSKKETYDEKQKQIREETLQILKQKQMELEQLQRKLKESQQTRKLAETQAEAEKIDLQKKIREQQDMIIQKQKEIQKNKKKINDTQSQKNQKSKQKYNFERKLLKTLPKCIELNLIAKQFKRNISMSVKMMLANQDYEQDDIQMKKRTILIKVVNRQVGYSYWWDVETLSNRYYIIKDMSQQYFQTGVIPTLDQNNDPFWEPQAPTLIGRGFLTTKALAYMFDNPATLPIIGEDQHCGQLTVNLVPTDETGTVNLCEEMDEKEEEFEPEDLLDRSLYYLILIKEARIPVNYKDIYVEYAVKINEEEREVFKTQVITQKTNLPCFNYRKLHKFQKVTQQLLDFLTTARITFKVYGCQVLEEQKKSKAAVKPSDILQPDVQKAKRQDLKKIQQTFSVGTQSINSKSATNKANTIELTKPQEHYIKKTQNYKTTGATTNNKIVERNQKNAKDKDCQIY